MSEFELGLENAQQYRASSLQLHNWGTFQGLHRMDISRDGFLIVGASGAGKSSLLDAMAALLVPPRWHDFNAAARDQERKGRDRSLVSYLRGAWSQNRDEESGEFATRYLRAETTWSALALEFDDGYGGLLSLVQLLWIRGRANRNEDVKRLYLILPRAVSLKEFEAFDLDVRKIKKQYAEDFCEQEFSAYQERFTRLLGIEREEALRLVHKTQSAKNLGDLNAFFRDFMLDRPDTFEAAEAMVEEFGKLDEAHKALIDARRQIETLRPARAARSEREACVTALVEAGGIQDHFEDWINAQKIELFGARLHELGREAEGLAEIHTVDQAALGEEERRLSELESRYRAEGGAELERLEDELGRNGEERASRKKKRDSLSLSLRSLGREVPASAEAFVELVGEGRDFLESWADPQGASIARQKERDDLVAGRNETKAALRSLEVELSAMERQPSNIPADFLARRRELARESGIQESRLPFVGELLEVLPGEEPWRGAIERVLRSFSLSLLVSEADWSSLARVVDQRFLGYRLVYFRVPDALGDSKRAASVTAVTGGAAGRRDRIPGKLELREGPWQIWLAGELAARFDLRCVENLRDLGANERAVTRAGQVRLGRDRFEKDDRSRVDDPSSWTLGFDNGPRRAAFATKAEATGRSLAALEARLAELEGASAREASLAAAFQRLSALEWRDIDVESLVSRAVFLEKSLAEARRKDGDLARLAASVAGQRHRRDEAGKILRASELARGKNDDLVTTMNKQLSGLREIARGPAIPARISAAIEALFSEDPRPFALEGPGSLDERARRAERQIGNRVRTLTERQAALESSMLQAFRDFIREWRAESGGLDASVESVPDFMARLDRLETEDLPAHEARFREYLQDQGYKHLSDLLARMDRARKEIRLRMDLVNASLAKAPFGPETHLAIETLDRQLADVMEFRASLRSSLDEVPSGDEVRAERRFEEVRRLVKRLESKEAADERWKSLVLDVRNHVEFVADEVDGDGRIVQVYRSGAGKSGGQRQRLATTCLAAALRYQLGGIHHGLPRFAMISMDEAFDKADSEFTARVMEVFREFGFQMIMATPNKAVMSLEPYIGGACYVGIIDERDSRLLPIALDPATGRLEIFSKPGGIASNAEEA